MTTEQTIPDTGHSETGAAEDAGTEKWLTEQELDRLESLHGQTTAGGAAWVYQFAGQSGRCKGQPEAWIEIADDAILDTFPGDPVIAHCCTFQPWGSRGEECFPAIVATHNALPALLSMARRTQQAETTARMDVHVISEMREENEFLASQLKEAEAERDKLSSAWDILEPRLKLFRSRDAERDALKAENARLKPELAASREINRMLNGQKSGPVTQEETKGE